MIRLTRLNGSEMYLNADLVATVESHHDTVVTLVDGRTYVVLESAEAVVASITNYRARVLATAEQQLALEPVELSLVVDGPSPQALQRPFGGSYESLPFLPILKYLRQSLLILRFIGTCALAYSDGEQTPPKKTE